MRRAAALMLRYFLPAAPAIAATRTPGAALEFGTALAELLVNTAP